MIVFALLGAGFLVLPFVARRIEAAAAPVGKAVLLGAVLLRLPLLPLPPALSDDMLRYLWDGKVAAAGFNPYALAPEAEELIPLRDGIWRRLPQRQVPTVYPPLAVAAFSIASRLPFPLLAWKLMATGADLLACWLLLHLARGLGIWGPFFALLIKDTKDTKDLKDGGKRPPPHVLAVLGVLGVLLAGGT